MELIKKIKCFFGFHDWSKVKEDSVTDEYLKVVYGTEECVNCGKRMKTVFHYE